MWTNTRVLLNQMFRRDDRSSSSNDPDSRRRTIRRLRRTNRANCLSRSSNRASTINSQLNRELLLNSSQNPTIRPPHARSRSLCHSSSNFPSNLSSPSSLQSACFTPLPTAETISHSSSPNAPQTNHHHHYLPSHRSLSPLLTPSLASGSSRYQVINCSPYSNLFNQPYLRSISRSIYNLAGEQGHFSQLSKEKNYLSSVINGLVIVTILISLLQPRWFSINGGLCNNKYFGLGIIDQDYMFAGSPSAPSIRIPFSESSSFHSNDQKPFAAGHAHEERKPNKLNYFRLTDDDQVHQTTTTAAPPHLALADHSPNQNNQNSQSNNSQSNPNDTQTSAQLLIESITKPIPTTAVQSPVQLIHLPIIQSDEKSRAHLLRKSYEKSYEKVKRYSNDESSILQFYKNLADHYQNNNVNECLSPDVLSLQHLIIILCVFAILSSLIQLLLDLIPTSNKYIILLQQNAIFNIICVVILIMVLACSYLLSNLLAKEQVHKHAALNSQYNHQFYHPNDHYHSGVVGAGGANRKPITLVDYFNLNKSEGKIEVRLEISYYLVCFAMVFSVVASLVNLFNKPNLYLININSDQETSNLLNENSQANGYWSHLFNVNNPNFRSLVNFYLQPPPSYEVGHLLSRIINLLIY